VVRIKNKKGLPWFALEEPDRPLWPAIIHSDAPLAAVSS